MTLSKSPKRKLCFALAACALLKLASVEANSLHYTIVKNDVGTPQLTLSFQQEHSNLKLLIPDVYDASFGAKSGVKNLNIVIEKCGVDIVYLDLDSRRIDIPDCPNSRVDISYELTQVNAVNGREVSVPNFLPSIEAGKWRWINAMAFVVPDVDSSEIHAYLNFKLDLKSAQVMSNLAVQGSSIKYAGPLDGFLNAFISFDETQRSHVPLGTNAVQLSLDENLISRQDEEFSMFIERLSKAGTLYRRNIEVQPEFSIQMNKVGSDTLNPRSTVKSFANGLWVETTSALNNREHFDLIVREVLGDALRDFEVHSTNEERYQQQWFTDGFADYFALASGKESGVVSQAAFNDAVNRRILWLKYSEFADLNKSEWDTLIENIPIEIAYPNMIKHIPRWKGFLLALNWDLKLRQKSSSLFETLSSLSSKVSGTILTNSKDSVEALLIAKGISGTKLDYENFILSNNGHNITQLKLANLGLTQLSEYQRFDMGFKLDDDQRVTKVNKASAAYLAGVRNKMVVRSSESSYGNPNEPVILRFKNGKNLSFYPSKKSYEHVLSPDTQLLTDLAD